MFSQVCVKNSIHRRGCVSSMQQAGVYTPRRQTPSLGRHIPQADPPPGRHPAKMATEAGSVHPTGMHSCYYFFYRTEQKVTPPSKRTERHPLNGPLIGRSRFLQRHLIGRPPFIHSHFVGCQPPLFIKFGKISLFSINSYLQYYLF